MHSSRDVREYFAFFRKFLAPIEISLGISGSLSRVYYLTRTVNHPESNFLKTRKCIFQIFLREFFLDTFVSSLEYVFVLLAIASNINRKHS